MRKTMECRFTIEEAQDVYRLARDLRLFFQIAACYYSPNIDISLESFYPKM